MYKGRLFTPRGLSGLGNLMFNEIKSVDGRMRIYKEETLERISNLGDLSRLRIPQSIWVPLVDTEVNDIAQVGKTISEIDWTKVPSLPSHGPRVSVHRGSVIRSKSEVLSLLMDMIPLQLASTELSLRINSENQLSLGMNAIPPRVWIRTPSEIEAGLDSMPTWSTRTSMSDHTTSKPSEHAVKIFRNESSLACLCAGLVRLSSLPSQLSDQPEVLVWDPFVGNGAVVMEVIQYVFDQSAKLEGEKTVTIVGNVGSKKTLSLVSDKISRLVSKSPGIVTSNPSHNSAASSSGGSGGRKKRNRSQQLESDDAMPNDSRIFSTSISHGKITVHVQLLAYPFEEVLPHISGACIVTHIPKTFNEILGIEKRELSEWSAFGNWIRTSSPNMSSMHVFSETDSFFKYSRMKFSKVIHLKSPGGNAVGSMAQWLGI